MRRPARDESKLPRWAQDLIRVLRANLEHERKRLLAVGDKYNTRVLVGPHRDQPVGFHADEHVRFYTAGDGTYYDVRISGQGIDVSLSGSRSDAIHVIPQAANVVRLRPGDFHD